MTQKSIPWNGVITGDAGPYTDAEWQELWRNIIGWGGSRANVGPILSSGDQPFNGLRVQGQSPATSSVDVLRGAALVQGIAFISDSTESFAVAANASGNPRIDTIVVRADYALQTARLTLIQGTPAASPSPPSLTQIASVMWDIPLADIAVANGFTTLSTSNITPRHEWVNAPPGVYLDNVLNNSGGTLQDGDVVVVDTSADRAAKTTTTADDKTLLGVWRGRTANGSYGRVQTLGIGYVRTTAATTRGAILTTSTTAGAAVPLASTGGAANASLGRALETTSGSGFVLTLISPHVVNDIDFVIVQDQKNSGTAGGNLTASAWTTHVLNTEVVDTGGLASVGSNQVTLQPGKWSAEWVMASGGNVGTTRTRLRDVTNNVTLGQSANGQNTFYGGVAEFVLTAAAAIELQYYTSSSLGNGLGLALSSGDVEVYASIKFTRHAETA